jgi:hypothetical protein
MIFALDNCMKLLKVQDLLLWTTMGVGTGVEMQNGKETYYAPCFFFRVTFAPSLKCFGSILAFDGYYIGPWGMMCLSTRMVHLQLLLCCYRIRASLCVMSH